MSTCVARKGFLTLSDCGSTAVRECTNCGRSLCSAHLAPQTGFTMCLDCAASNPAVQEGEHDDVWSRRYRTSYYGATGYVPYYSSHHHRSSYYSDQDTRSFDERHRDGVDDEGGRGGFADS